MTASWLPLWGAITRGPGPLAGRLETRHHTRGVAGPAGCFSRTLSASLQLCRKCNRTALGRPSLGMDDLAIRVQHTCLQPFANQVEKGPVVDAHAQHVQEPCMVHMLEEAF